MLATFMAGLAVGGLVGGRLARGGRDRLRPFGLCELGIGVTGLMSVPLLYAAPRLYLPLFRSFHLYPALFLVLQVLICALVMLIPTILMGATFPLVARAITAHLEEMGERIGKAYAFNTVGAVIGSLAAGFVFVPVLGIRGAAFTAAGINLAVGLVVLLLAGAPLRGLAASMLVLYIPAGTWALSARQDSTLIGYYTARRYAETSGYEQALRADIHQLEPLLDRQYAEGALRVFRAREDGSLVLQVGGKIESGPRDRETAALAAYLPLAARPSAESMLVIGLGAGVTLGAADESVADLTVVEIHPGVVDAVRRFGPPGLLDGKNVVIDDARHHLASERLRYDVITSAPSLPTEAGVGNLFTLEFFETVSERLHDGGVYCQWLPYFLLDDDDVTMMVRTFGSVFPYASLWKKPDTLDLFLLGSRHPPADDSEVLLDRVSGMRGSTREPPLILSRDSQAIEAIARRDDVPLNTDDRPLLEFRTARNLLLVRMRRNRGAE
jgi:spermidine synthase